MEPSEVASDFMDKLVNYCISHASDYTECIAGAMEGLDKVLSFFFTRTGYEVDPEIGEAINNSDTFRDEVEKELKEMLNHESAITMANETYGLSSVLYELYDNVVDNEDLINFRKVKLLKAYEKVLEEFVNVIDRALKEKKPLSKKDLYDWFMNIGETVIGTEAYDWIDPQVDFWLSHYYDMLNDDYKLEMLEYIQDYIIEDMLPRIKQKLSELEALTNK
jgi:hypothetical protein